MGKRTQDQSSTDAEQSKRVKVSGTQDLSELSQRKTKARELVVTSEAGKQQSEAELPPDSDEDVVAGKWLRLFQQCSKELEESGPDESGSSHSDHDSPANDAEEPEEPCEMAGGGDSDHDSPTKDTQEVEVSRWEMISEEAGSCDSDQDANDAEQQEVSRWGQHLEEAGGGDSDHDSLASDRSDNQPEPEADAGESDFDIQIGEGENGDIVPRGPRSSSDLETTVPVQRLRYSQRSCKATFRDGKDLQDLMRDLKSGAADPLKSKFLILDAVEQPCHWEPSGVGWFVIDNRRLYCLKQYQESVSHKVLVRVRIIPREIFETCLRAQNNLDTENSGASIHVRGGRRHANR